MKKLLSFLFAVFVILSAQAQSEHLKFMGIPLDGKIKAFNKELQKKGFTLDKFAGKRFDGTYIYNGVFAGEIAQIFVNYDNKTKIVYKAGVVIENYSKEQAVKKYQAMRDMIEEKYSQNETIRYLADLEAMHEEEMKEKGMTPFEWKRTTEYNGYETTTFLIPDSESLVGDITVFVSESIFIRNTPCYTLYIRYSDWQNDESHFGNEMDDL